MIVITKLIGDTVNTLLVTDSFKEASDAFYSLINEEVNEYVFDTPVNETVEMKKIGNNIIFKADDNEGHTITLQAI